jgi:raffinose/stachyose/melibiose transport system substrate-binding protein
LEKEENQAMNEKKKSASRGINRRDFIKLGAIGAVAGVVAACSPAATPQPPAPPAAPTQPPPPPPTQPPAPTAVPPTMAPAPTAAPVFIPQREVTIWHINTGVGSGDLRGIAFDAVMADFEKTHSGIKVTQNKVYHEDAKIIFPNVIKTSTPPDVIQLREYTIARPAYDAGLIKDLSTLWSSNTWDKTFGTMTPSLLWRGKHYFVPLELGTFNGLMYITNLKKTQDFQDPKTFADFETLAEELKGKGIPALLVANKEKWWAPIVLQCLMEGVSVPATYDKLIVGQAKWTDDWVVEAFNQFKTWMDKGYFYPDMNAYATGDVFPIWTGLQSAFLYAGPWAGGSATAAGEEYDYFPWPVKDSSIPQRVNGNGEPYSIPTNAPHPKEAEEMIVYLASKEAQQIFADGYQGMVCNTEVDYSKQPPIVQKMVKDMSSLYFVTHMNWDVPLPVNTALLEAVSAFVSDPTDANIKSGTESIEKAAVDYWSAQK